MSKPKRPPPKVKLLTDSGGVAHAGEVMGVAPAVDIMKLLHEHNAVEKAVETLVELLDATVEHFDKNEKQWVLEVDGLTRTTSAKILVAYGVGEPVKRQQILSGKLPTGDMSRDDMKKEIDRKLAERISRPDVTTAELLQARKLLEEAGKDEKSTYTEEQAVAEAKRIHGMSEEVPLVGMPPVTQEPLT